MIEQYLIQIIKNMKVENICLESSEDKTKWYFTCYIGKAYGRQSQEVWIEGKSPFEVLEKALVFIDRYRRGCHMGSRKKSKWTAIKELQEQEITASDMELI